MRITEARRNIGADGRIRRIGVGIMITGKGPALHEETRPQFTLFHDRIIYTRSVNMQLCSRRRSGSHCECHSDRSRDRFGASTGEPPPSVTS